ncbi:hypothetical protein CBS115989_6523 [Aspergillus niger]|nr:hypothetical protein CBS115989_6523 [Aspergillus niger]KAI2852021.1 hypothetical protein CBS11232_5767 [Aspergillus niger]KAI2874069.1 hypothetical protein CBS115988_6501 [Aspergillus niger]KAI3065330.1 hypothetical protein CBS147353_8387 [Aspergillus niger]
MALTSMPLVFSKEVKHYDPEDWYSEIQKNSQDYESLRIASLTRVKDLDSDWAHEYVEFIIQGQLPIGRARVYAKRGVPKISIDKVPPAMSVNTSTGAVDGVTIGVNECDKEGRWRGLPHDLPLPLEYFVYADKKLSFISLAKTISEVSKKGAAYKLLRNNCYWFAYTVMKVWGSVHKESKKVVAYNLGGSGQTLEDLWSYGKALWYNNTFKAPDSSGITSKQLGLNEPQARQHYLVEELLDRFAATVVAEMDNDSD